mgnify:CR=1
MKKQLLFYLLVWTISVASFWTVFYNYDPIGYSVIFLWLLIPITSFVANMSITATADSIIGGLLSIPIFGVFNSLAYYLTFSLANMIAFDKINKPSRYDFLVGCGIALIGFVVGLLVRAFRRRRI